MCLRHFRVSAERRGGARERHLHVGGGERGVHAEGGVRGGRPRKGRRPQGQRSRKVSLEKSSRVPNPPSQFGRQGCEKTNMVPRGQRRIPKPHCHVHEPPNIADKGSMEGPRDAKNLSLHFIPQS